MLRLTAYRHSRLLYHGHYPSLSLDGKDDPLLLNGVQYGHWIAKGSPKSYMSQSCADQEGKLM